MNVTTPEPDSIGVEITDFDLRTVDAEGVATILSLVYEHKLVVFRDQGLTKEEYLDMARRFGRPQVYFQNNYHHPEHPEIFVSSNVPEEGHKVGVAGTGQFWHTDYSFFDEPLSLTFVAPQTVPPGDRCTWFIDLERVLRDMPEHLRSLVEGRRLFHEATWYYKVQPKDVDRAVIDLVRDFREMSRGAYHPAVITHPVTGRRTLYLSEGFTTAVEGLTYEESADVLSRLFEFVNQERYIHSHAWRERDIMLWDNRPLIHQASPNPKQEPSVSYRIGVYDAFPFYVEKNESTAITEARPAGTFPAQLRYPESP